MDSAPKRIGPFDLCYNPQNCFKNGCIHYHMPKLEKDPCIYYIRYACVKKKGCDYSHEKSYEKIAKELNSKVLIDFKNKRPFILDTRYTDKYILTKVKERQAVQPTTRVPSPMSSKQLQQQNIPARNRTPSRPTTNTLINSIQLSNKKNQAAVKQNKANQIGQQEKIDKAKDQSTGYVPNYDEWDICKFGATCNNKSCPSHHPQWLKIKNFCIMFFRDEGSCNEKYCKYNHFKWLKVKNMRFITEDNSKDFKTGLPFQAFKQEFKELCDYKVNEECKCSKCLSTIFVKPKYEKTVTTAIGKFVCMDCMKKKFSKYEEVIFKIKAHTDQL